MSLPLEDFLFDGAGLCVAKIEFIKIIELRYI